MYTEYIEEMRKDWEATEHALFSSQVEVTDLIEMDTMKDASTRKLKEILYEKLR